MFSIQKSSVFPSPFIWCHSSDLWQWSGLHCRLWRSDHRLHCSQCFPQLLDIEASWSGAAPGAACFGVSDSSLVLQMKLQPEKRQDHFWSLSCSTGACEAKRARPVATPATRWLLRFCASKWVKFYKRLLFWLLKTNRWLHREIHLWISMQYESKVFSLDFWTHSGIDIKIIWWKTLSWHTIPWIPHCTS